MRSMASARSLKNSLELLDLAPVKFRQVRVRENRQFRLRRLADIDVERPAFVLENLQALLH